MFLPAEIIPIAAQTAPVFTAPTDQKASGLVIGAILPTGPRTVTSALRAVGHTRTADRAKYHHVRNRARWSGLQWSARLLLVLSATFGAAGGVTIAVDETLERRWGHAFINVGTGAPVWRPANNCMSAAAGCVGSCSPWS